MNLASETKLFSEKKTSYIVRRWVSLWIDLIALAGVMILLEKAFSGIDSTGYKVASWTVLGLYFVGCETVLGGTLGKFATRMRIVDAEGKPCTARQIVVRSLWRILETNPIAAGGLIAGIACLSSQTCQRIGDYYAKTYVVGLSDLQLLRERSPQVPT